MAGQFERSDEPVENASGTQSSVYNEINMAQFQPVRDSAVSGMTLPAIKFFDSVNKVSISSNTLSADENDPKPAKDAKGAKPVRESEEDENDPKPAKDAKGAKPVRESDEDEGDPKPAKDAKGAKPVRESDEDEKDPKPAKDAKTGKPNSPKGDGDVDLSAIAKKFGLRDLSQVEVETTKIGGKEFSLQKYQGKTEYFQDSSGSWRSPDKSGQKWERTGSDGKTVKWRGTVEIGPNNEWVKKDLDNGITDTFQKDGTHKRETANESVVKDKKGVPVSFNGSDGTTWLSENGQEWHRPGSEQIKKGTPSISDSGEFKFSPAKDNPEELQKLKDELRDKYGVKIAKAGETTVTYKHRFTAGEPTVAELKMVRDTLDKLKHLDTKGMKVWFMDKDQEVPKSLGNMSAVYHGSYTGSPEVLLLPGARKTAARGWNAAEGNLYHELTHHDQLTRGLFGMGLKESEQSKKLMDEMGWENTAKHGMVLKDKDGNSWKHDPSKNKPWQFVAGNRPEDGELSLTTDQMKERAVVKPATSYFPNAAEMHAEGLAMYLHSPELLRRTSPELYKIMQSDFEAARKAAAARRR